MSNEDLCLGVRALADATGMTTRTLQRLASEGSILKIGQDKYSVMSLLKYLCSKRAVTRDLSELRAEKLAAQVEGERLRNSMLELDLKVRDGSLLDQEEVYLTISNVLIAFRNRILGIPSKLALQISGINDAIQIQSLLLEELTEALNELAENFREDEE